MWVQFSDATETTIIAIFACPQDPAIYHNQGNVPVSDSRYLAFYNSLPPEAQKDLPTP